VSAVLVFWIVARIERPEQVARSIAGASILPLVAIVPVSFLSHWFRATRWRRFLGRPVPRFYAFSSVMIGYAVNDVVPRGGEVARVVNMWRTTGTPAPSLAATLVAERFLDVIILVGFLGFSLVLEGDRISEAFPAVAGAGPSALGLAVVGIGFLVAMAFAGGRLAELTERIAGKIHRRLGSALGRIVREGAQGLAIVRRPRAAAVALLETGLIWSLYLAAHLLGLAAFHLLDGIGVAGGTVSFSITSCSVLVPSQGAIGAYHKLGQESLHLLYGVDSDSALACVTVLHAILFIGVGGLGGAAVWFLQSLRLGRGRAITR
jgi:uncharacterized protein (TIRG00374 family)